MIGRWLTLQVFGLLIFAAARADGAAADPSLPPASYKPLAVGTVLHYGSWRCTVEEDEDLQTVCAGNGHRARFFGRFVNFGDQDSEGYGGATPEVPFRTSKRGMSSRHVDTLSMDAAARRAIRDFWPLSVGKRASLVVAADSNPGDHFAMSLEVTGTERLRVAGRERDVYVITARSDFNSQYEPRYADVPPYTNIRTWWYDPNDGIVVKARLVWERYRGLGYDHQYELVEVRAPQSPTVDGGQIARLREEERRLVEKQRREVDRLKALVAEMEAKAQGLSAARGTGAVKHKGSPAASISFGDYHALVIGIEAYKNLKPLRTAVADAEAVADVLEREYGFKVTRLINPSRADILDALDRLRETLRFKDNLLIYYAGHGWLDTKADRGYWLAADAKKNRRSRWVSNATITDTLKAIESKHVMVVSDSCYSGRLVRGAAVRIENADTPEYFQKMSRTKARVVITSGGLEPVEDGNGLHSPFARAFLQALEENDGVMDGSRLFAALRRPVMVSANQTPQYSDVRRAGHEGGEFLFVRRQ